MDTWLEITLSLPVIEIILYLIILIGIVIGVVFYFRKIRTRDQVLYKEIDELESRNQSLSREIGHLNEHVVEINNSKSNWESDQKAYQNFLYNVSHEVSNPLQSILTNLDNMSNITPEETGLWQQYHSIISSEIRRLINLTENLRQLSRLETKAARINREPLNIKAVIEDVMMALADKADARDVRLIYDGPDRPARIMGDREQLQQVLTNLVDNGIKYSQNKGGEVIINVLEEPENICVRVIDNGIGIPEEDLPFIFETAYRSPETRKHKRQGSGYGLAIVKRIVEQHGGSLEVQSRQSEGTTFHFDLPLYTPSDE